MLKVSALLLASMPASIKISFMPAFTVFSAFKIVFLLWENPALINLKNSLSSDTIILGLLSIRI